MIILNEKEYAEKCINNSDIGDNPYFTISILARYYSNVCGYKPKKIFEILTSFIKSTYPRYSVNTSEWINTIDKLSKTASKHKLFISDGVWITESELKEISRLNNKILEKIYFTMLCLAKLGNQKSSNNNNWVNTSIKDIFNMAGVNCSNKLRASRLKKLIDKGYIRFANRIDNLNMQVLFLDEESTKKILINDFRELGNEYLFYNGENYIRCAECGRLVKNNKNRTRKYCDTCSAYTPLKTKVITCVDCGKAFIVSSMNNKTCRCKTCQTERLKKLNRERKQKERNNAR